MTTNLFSEFKEGEISRSRRVGHSFTNYYSSMDWKEKLSTKAGLAESATQGVAAVANVGGILGLIGGGLAIAGAGAAGAGFFVAVAGPQVAVTAGVVGLALLAKGTYTNREAAHRELSRYVWNMVDDDPPPNGVCFTDDALERAANAALTLMDDGKSQIKLLGPKLETAKVRFDRFNQDVGDTTAQLLRLRASPQAANAEMAKLRTKMDQAVKQGGAIFEYVRRCCHTGNYIQAPHLLSLAMKEKCLKGSVGARPRQIISRVLG